MKYTKGVFIIAALILMGVLAGALWVGISGWPIIRNREYRDLITNFQSAKRIEKTSQP